MTKTPDPNYWGNPPQTPTRNNTAANTTQSGPQMPYQAAPYQTQPSDSQGQTQQQAQSWQGQNQGGFQGQPQGQTQGRPQNTDPNTTPTPPVQKKSHRGCIIAAIIAVILVLLLGISGCVACSALVASVENSQHNRPTFELPDSGTPDDPTASMSNEYFRDAYGLYDSNTSASASLTTDELNSLQSDYFVGESKQQTEDGQYAPGVYYVGSDIPAGSYWFEGDDEDLSYFYILQPSDSNDGTYDVTHMNSYYGHNLMEVKDGEVLVLDNGDGMIPLDSMTETFSSPYGSGTYRVGVDIPAGTYQLSLGDAADYSACYIMKDLNYNNDSYLYEAYYIDGDQAEEITLEEGTYVELYNMSMRSITA